MRFDLPLVHRSRDRRAGDEVAAELRKDDALADRAGLVSGAPDALQAARDRWRRLDLHDEIDGAHVDAELERRCGDERADAAGLEQFFDLAPLRRAPASRDAIARAVRRPARSARRRAVPPVAGCSRRAASSDARESARAAADAPTSRSTAAPVPATPGLLRSVRLRRQTRHVFDRHLDAQGELLLLGGVDDRDRRDT